MPNLVTLIGGAIIISRINWWEKMRDSVFMPLLQQIIDAFPDGWQQNLTGSLYWLQVANSWIPLDFFAFCMLGYCAFWSVFTTTKIIIRLIPTVG